MRYGFVIDHDACIGCHACTVACKAENDVPVGSFRTWVKYAETGRWPETQRHFLVQRCNHCDDAPCVTICPVKALEKRADGIVDLDRDACIGCRACMQACPYDSIYLNPDSGAAEKCHYCAHRVEVGLAPACVNVCPVNAILPGDLDDASSPAGKALAERPTQVRRPEQGTGPNVHYVGAPRLMLEPGAAERPPIYLWSDRPPDKPEPWPKGVPTEPDARTVLDVRHRVEWGWQVALYLVTKGIAGGAAMLAPFAAALGLEGFAARWAPELLALVFTAVTCGLLVEDLARPWRFYRLLTRPNWRSWLVRGGVVLSAFGGVTVAILGLRLLGHDALADGLRWVNALLGVAAAGYTAFLFAQCRGRDLWESRLLLPHLLVQAILCGAAALAMVAPAAGALAWPIALGAVAHGAFALRERFGAHPTDNARQAAGFLGVVRLAGVPACAAAIGLGVIAAAPIAFLLPALGGALALVGLWAWEHAFVRAGQLPPLS